MVSGPPGLSAVRTGKTENQIGFSIYQQRIVSAEIGVIFTHLFSIDKENINFKWNQVLSNRK
ncbi:MAG: hypothetical protein D8M57_03505 [Candidatus Scalindua sp. AMX11]|nr:MAG: hypothetical protein D8M57_03505 [Candidatus Scalindua sp. AMX11]